MTLVRTSKMATVNICDRTQAGQTKRLRFHSINFAENVVSLKEKICKEIDRELNNIGNTQTLLKHFSECKNCSEKSASFSFFKKLCT